MSFDDKKETKVSLPGPCQISFDYNIEVAGFKTNGTINKMVPTVRKPEEFTEEIIQREIQASTDKIIENAIRDNPAAFKDLDGQFEVKIGVDNVSVGCFTTDLNIKR
ncbi:hypothetical protein ACOZB2_03890 [Pantoea endophytica]|uniref:Uncharacterized protein n=1 Tax=Pantoea sp. BJ2 TaxID=3141322 RepID=A0AAU7U581_9GAMM